MASRQPYPLDHATHLPILIGLGFLFPIRKVVEFGCGVYSTMAFLNRSLFPLVDVVFSHESDVEWARKLYGLSEGDTRLKLVDGAWPSDNCADLVFIDNSPAETRAATIRKVVRNFPGLVVIHDSEVFEYKQEINEFPYRHYFFMFNPETSVCCNRLLAPSVDLLGSIISRHSEVSPDNVDKWVEIFKGEL